MAERASKLKRALRAVIGVPVYRRHCVKKKGREDDPGDKEPPAIINDSAFWDAVDNSPR